MKKKQSSCLETLIYLGRVDEMPGLASSMRLPIVGSER